MEDKVDFIKWGLIEAIEEAIVGIKLVEERAEEAGKRRVQDKATIILFQLERLKNEIDNTNGD